MRLLTIVLSFLFCLNSAAAQPSEGGEPTAPSAAALDADLDAAPEPMEAQAPIVEDIRFKAYLDGVIAAYMREHRIPGVTLAVVRDGRPLVLKGYGDADIAAGKAVDPTTLFRIGSVSKTFTWTAVMMLVERGALNLDADVNEYLNEIQIPEKFGAPVTLNHLMTHRAGFEDSFGVYTVDVDEEKSLGALLNETMPVRIYPPGARVSYSNWGSALAAKIVENVSGVPYAEFLKNEILAPLGMGRAELYGPWRLDDATAAAISKGYELKNGAASEAAYMAIGEFAPAGAMNVSAEDMANWMMFHLNEGALGDQRLLAPALHRQFQERVFAETETAPDMGRGFFRSSYKGVELFGHGGGTASFLTNMMMAPDLSLGVFVSQNSTTDSVLIRQLHHLVLDHVLNATETTSQPTEPQNAETFAEFAGVYFTNRRTFSRFEKVLGVTNATTLSPADGGVVIQGKDPVLYRPTEEKDVFINDQGERISFYRTGDGAVSHFTDKSGVHSYDRPTGLDSPSVFNGAFLAVIFFTVTILLGAWRRQGRHVEQNAAGRLLGLADLAMAALVLVFFGALAAAVAALSGMDLSTLNAYPPSGVGLAQTIGVVVAVGAAATALLTVPVWTASGWSIWRKLHHTAFALALVLFAATLINARIILAATA